MFICIWKKKEYIEKCNLQQCAPADDNKKEKSEGRKEMANNTQTAADILNAIGGKENVDSVAHCMTRLRLKLKDESIVRDEEISKINGVIKVLHVSGQLQIVIGTHVDKVYDEVCRLGNFEKQALDTDIVSII